MLGKNLLCIEEHKPPTLRELSDEDLKRVVGGTGDWLSDGSTSHFLTMLFSAFTPFLIGFTSIGRKKVSTNVKPETSPLPIQYPYPHTSVPEHAPRLVEEGKWQSSNKSDLRQQAPKKGIAYERPRSQYDSQYLQENAERLTQRFLAALRNQQDALNPAAQQGLHILAETMGKTEGTSLSQLASEHNMPISTLSRLVHNRLIPILYRDKHTIYLAHETAQNIADLNQKAKKERKPLARLLREKQDKSVPEPHR
jgi:hypothetical protein